MNCKRAQKYLADYRAGLLDSYLHDLVDRHISECKTCRAILKKEESITDFLHSADSSDGAASELASEILQKVKGLDENPPLEGTLISSRMSPWMRWGLIAAMIVTFLIIGLLVFPFHSSEDHYHSSYSPVGYTWMGPGMEDLDDGKSGSGNNEDIIGVLGGGSVSVYTGADLQGDSPEDSGRINHTFDLSPGSETPTQTDVRRNK